MADRETDLRNLKAIKSKLEKIKELERKIESAKASIRNEEKKIEDVDVPKGKTDNEKSTRERIERRREQNTPFQNFLIAVTFIIYVVAGVIATYKAYEFLMANVGSFEFLGHILYENYVIFFIVGIGFVCLAIPIIVTFFLLLLA